MAQNQNDDQHTGFLWAALGVLVLFMTLRFLYGDEIAWVYTAVRRFFLEVVTAVWPRPSWVAALRFIETRDIREINWDQLTDLSNRLRFVLFLVWGPLLGWFAYRTIKKNPAQRFRRVLTRQTLAREMSGDFPWILPVLDQDLTKMSIHEGPWAMASSPLQFARRNGLMNGIALDPVKANKRFIMQLGRLWTDPGRLNAHSKALFSVFAALTYYKKNSSKLPEKERDKFKDNVDSILRDLAIEHSRTPGKRLPAEAPVWQRCKVLFDKYARDPAVTAITRQHAYERTVMVAMFFAASKAGILPPNFFLWLRPLDRSLWVTLNCVMRRTYFSEVGGIYAHFLAEQSAGHKIEEPMIEKATLALDISLRSIKIDPDDMSDDIDARELPDTFDPRQAERETALLAAQMRRMGDLAVGDKEPGEQPA
jgi:intracellular multiplication protein IcmP